MTVDWRRRRRAVSADTPARIALYSHDTCGLGHFRRNLLIARTLRSRLGADVLLLSGIRESGSFAICKGIDTLHLPALKKVDNLDYRPRHLDIELERLVRIRSATLLATLSAFEPDAFIVDNVPCGAMGELEESLRTLRARGETYTVLGLRDVLDTPENVRREWLRPRNVAAIGQLYDSVWVYGDAAVYDLASEYELPTEVRSKLRFTGYLNPLADNRALRELAVRAGDQPDLCVVGGGHDGVRLATAFADACAQTGREGMIVTGPFMDESAIARLHEFPGVAVRRFVSNPLPLYAAARCIVSMGGYNTVLELLALGRRPLIVPRTSPRREQLVRAEAFTERGLVDVLHPDRLRPDRIVEWLDRDHSARHFAHRSIDMTGLRTIVEVLRNLTRSPHAGGAIAV